MITVIIQMSFMQLYKRSFKMEIIGIGILFMIGIYLAPFVIGFAIMLIAGIFKFLFGGGR